MQTFVKHNFKTLLEDKTLCDVSIDVSRENEEKKTFHCVGALIAVHSNKLKDKIFCTSDIKKLNSIELIESKEEEIIELDDDFPLIETEECSIILPLDNSDNENMDINNHHLMPYISDISTITFSYLRRLFYGLNPLISTDNVIGIYDTSVKYNLIELRTASLSYIDNLSIEDYPLQFLSIILDCQNYELYSMIDTLILKLPNHISQTFFTLMINNEYFNNLSNAVIEMLLFQNNTFKNLPQEYLWIAVLKWAKNKYSVDINDESDNSNETDTNIIDNESDDSVSEEKREIIKLSSDDDDKCNEINEIINHKWNSDSLSKLRHFIQYFDFYDLKHLFFREYVANITGLLSKNEIISVFQSHCDDMINSMKSMENIIELQQYDSNYDNTHNLNTKRYKMQMYKTKEICYHSQEINLDIINNDIFQVQNNHRYPSIPSYNYPQLKLFIEQNIKSLFNDNNNLLADVKR
eukprot:107569_1